jgi:hypothetical protein
MEDGFGDSACPVFRIEEFIEALFYFSIVSGCGQFNGAEPWRRSRVGHKSELDPRVFGEVAP